MDNIKANKFGELGVMVKFKGKRSEDNEEVVLGENDPGDLVVIGFRWPEGEPSHIQRHEETKDGKTAFFVGMREDCFRALASLVLDMAMKKAEEGFETADAQINN